VTFLDLSDVNRPVIDGVAGFGFPTFGFSGFVVSGLTLSLGQAAGIHGRITWCGYALLNR